MKEASIYAKYDKEELKAKTDMINTDIISLRIYNGIIGYAV